MYDSSEFVIKSYNIFVVNPIQEQSDKNPQKNKNPRTLTYTIIQFPHKNHKIRLNKNILDPKQQYSK